jgi:hypothetical protein
MNNYRGFDALITSALPCSPERSTMLTAAQRAEILGLTAESDLDPSTVTDEDIWYDFLASLLGAGKKLKDLKLSPSQRPEIMACLRRAPSVAPRQFKRGGEGIVRSSPASIQSPHRRAP